ncbi:hypothetical protein [Paracidovorax valerianellae]|uniref:hypothetical protein n=1 Tax=Paracidovorax valerianellae TaxID=187868 RepID=UPI001113E1C1|nr:hypothetical protein [Paracidovorax valerianellae]MDA8447177.1 hypothetical protein [Paracidovorax valerianellae]
MFNYKSIDFSEICHIFSNPEGLSNCPVILTIPKLVEYQGMYLMSQRGIDLDAYKNINFLTDDDLVRTQIELSSNVIELGRLEQERDSSINFRRLAQDFFRKICRQHEGRGWIVLLIFDPHRDDYEESVAERIDFSPGMLTQNIGWWIDVRLRFCCVRPGSQSYLRDRFLWSKREKFIGEIVEIHSSISLE